MSPNWFSHHPPQVGRVSRVAPRLSTVLCIVVGTLCASFCLGATPSPDIPLSELLVNRWTVEDGLPSNSLVEVSQSPEGYLWISSFSGLTRFDGNQFNIYDRSYLPNLTTDGFTHLTTDRFGRFWIGTRGDGLLTYNRGQFRSFGHPLPARAAIMDILVDDQQQIWIGVDDLGAFRYEGGRPIPIPNPQVLDVTVSDLAMDSEGAVWIGTSGKGLTRFFEGGFTTYTTHDGLPDNQIGSLLPGDEYLWISTPRGLARLKGKNIEIVPELREVPADALLEDEHGSLWVGSDKGLMRFHPITGKAEVLSSFEGQILRGIGSMTVDREGSLWFTTFSGGLFQVRRSVFKNFTQEDGLDGDVVDTICEVGSDEVWVGTYSGTVNTIVDGKVGTVDFDDKLRGRARNIYRDREGGVWISSNGGLIHRKDGKSTLYTEEHGLPSLQTRVTFQGSSGQIWVGTSLGMAHFTEEQTFEVEQGELGTRFILSIDEDLDGRLVVGTRGSLLIREESGEIRRFSAEHGMPGSVVFSTFVDPGGAIWLATNGGLGRLKDGRIRALDKRRGLPIDSVFDLKLDSLGYLWLTSAVGVIRAPFDDLQAYMDGEFERVETELFDEHDGMVNRECVGARKILQATDEKLWIPTLGGVTRVDPLDLPPAPPTPEVVIDRFRVDGVAFNLDQPRPVLPSPNRPLSKPEAPTSGSVPHFLDPGPQRIELGFSAPSFVAPSKVRIRYMLEGFDPGWISAQTDRAVSYTNLPPGNYRFRAVAASSEGRWPEEEAVLEFSIRPAFHQTAAFFTLAGGLTLWGIVWLFRRRMAAVHHRNVQLKQRIERQQQVELEREKLIKELEVKNQELEQLGYSFSHDLKTPLVSIHGFLGLLEEDTAAGDSRRVREDMDQIRAAADRMNRLLNGLRELSSLGRRDMGRQTLPFAEVVQQALLDLADSLKERRATVHVAKDLPYVVGRRHQLVRAVSHLIDNAAKFAADDDEPQIEVGTRDDGRQTVFFVRDRGIGIDRSHHMGIFGLFNRLDQNREGVGIGLAVAERVIKTHSGRIWVESEGEGRGATFCFTLGLR